nr:flagellar biosynthetic protein FliO [uncultured Cellulosilyticum sp.]
MTKDIFDIILLLIVFAGILALTYYVTQKMAMMSKKMHFNKNMEIVEVLQVGGANYIYIIKVGNAYHLFAGGQKQGLNYCRQIDEKELQFKEVASVSFAEQLSHFVKGKKVEAHDEE